MANGDFPYALDQHACIRACDKCEPMHNTTVYLLKNPIDMRYGMLRLQEIIDKMLQRTPKDSFYFFHQPQPHPAQRHLV